MSELQKIVVGIRSSNLSQSQTNLLIQEVLSSDPNLKKDLFDVKTIKTTGDIHNTHRLDRIGGKGLFIKEIEEQIISGEIDIGVHSMKDVPAQEALPDLISKSGGEPVTMAANGGRIGKQEGGIMEAEASEMIDMGGMEKDFRNEGGFVAMGGKERADDVPARLSKNEFVFTADAVRNAGGGDIDKGAEVMENLMSNLEQGGEISEESQGLEGAQAMYDQQQMLQSRVV